ncbi:T9SS type A sorting domain-containing protein [Aquimarina sp. RZ0]|uniref:T9SS type A sorting domain-containing protein n=1 Tax=Aquimarina sp. RZ0 TaxID=2607730 RepID=UPI0011F2ABA8|nr:T9SS type A sorting domain-containing protein [Aquimarina sp. RZ0]KAA1247688.1 T9SS type A sorting domain-containing protein [Aquimarina sp. RZ0]
MKNILKNMLYTLLLLGMNVIAQQDSKTFQIDQEKLIKQEKETLQKILSKQPNETSLPRNKSDNQIIPLCAINNKTHKDWRKQVAEKKSKKKAMPVIVNENENNNQNLNNTPATAEMLPNFGTAENNTSNILIKGGLAVNDSIRSLEKIIAAKEENNGTIPLSQKLELVDFEDSLNIQKQTFITSSIIKNTPRPSNNDTIIDVDMYEFFAEKNSLVEIKVSNLETLDFFPRIAVVTEEGFHFGSRFSQLEDGEISVTLEFVAPLTKKYYIFIGPSNSFVTDPFDSINGTIKLIPEAPIGEGSYELKTSVYKKFSDVDHYAMDLEKGDVFGIAVKDFLHPRTLVSLLHPDGTLGIKTNVFTNTSVSEASIGPTSGETSFTYVIPENGRYVIKMEENIGKYQAELAVSRPGFETNNKGKKQFIYLDFTGVEEITLREFLKLGDEDPDNEVLNRVRSISPFKDFLENWNIENNVFSLIKSAVDITKVVKENFKDLEKSNINPDFEVTVLSDYGNDRLGKRIPQILETIGVPYSRVIIGGTSAEFGIPTIGLANNFDIGNYEYEDDAIVLLDLLSNPDSPFNITSINSVPLAEGYTTKDVMPVVIGNIVSHEIGHYLGNAHSDSFNNTPTLMDEGSAGIVNLTGVSLGGAFGDPTTKDIDFVKDEFVLKELIASDFGGDDFPVGQNLSETITAFGLGFTSGFNRSQEILSVERIKNMEDQVIENALKELTDLQAFSYPNPQSTQEKSKLVFYANQKGTTSVQLYEISGRKIADLFSGNLQKGEKKQLELMPSTYKLSPGIYFYTIKTSDKSFTHKFSVK